MSRKPWTDAEVALLRDRYTDSRTEDIAKALGRSLTTVYQKALGMGLRKSAGYLASENAGRIQFGKQHPAMQATQFPKGLVPWNKGVKGSTGVQERCRATQFKPGRPAHEARNYLPIGSLRLSPCPGGHVAARYTLSGYCVECQRRATREQKAAAKAKRGSA